MILRKPYLSTKARSQRSEKRAAHFLGGKVQPASGAINRFDLKADVKSKHFLLDDKTTEMESFKLSFALWRKLVKEAWLNKKHPMIRIESPKETLYVVDEFTMHQLLTGELSCR